jgi:hypothetical protein
MKLIPIHNTRKYNFWRITTPYLLFPLNHKIESENGIDYELGFRLSTIITVWTTIESFVRAALHEKGQVSINKISQKSECQQKITCWGKIKRFFKGKKKLVVHP